MDTLNTRLAETDLDLHAADLIDCGEDPNTDSFWDRRAACLRLRKHVSPIESSMSTRA